MTTYHTVFLRLRDRHGNTVLGVEILRKEVDDRTNPMVPDRHRPLELRYGVVEDYIPQMASTLQSVASQGTRRADPGAYTHRDRISSIVDVGDVLSGRLENRVMR